MALGKKTGGGSRKGKPNKATAALKDIILGALDDVGGRAYLARQAKENPTAFMSLIGRVLPTTLAGDKDNPIQIANADQREAIISRVLGIASRSGDQGTDKRPNTGSVGHA